MDYLHIQHNGCKTTIELLNTPLVKIWKKQFKKNQNQLTLVNAWSLFSHDEENFEEHFELGNKYVDTINKAISNLNYSISGKKYPYHAYYGMPWSHTNRMHRSFTIGRLSNNMWDHTMTAQQLLQFKKDCYINKIDAFDKLQMPSQFVVLDKDLYAESLEIINHYIHLYESLNKSIRSAKLLKEQGPSGHIVYNVDNTLPTGEKINFDYERISYDDLKESFPDDYFNYNVFIAHEITGKSYETCYVNYDDPLEYDITNIDSIDGSFTVYDSDSLHPYYEMSGFKEWLNSYGLGYQPLVYAPPIGKVVSTTCSSQMFETSENFYLDGSPAPKAPFDKTTYSLEEQTN